ncbi:protein SOB FIVE-LIKE 5-like [Rhododendron vialii]|uniref:protein SOB FIVE-LIKE 5-like n=1 Tax=Rhododendron vialii TaxID=182163 RepID=UPI00265D9FC3|nr:protein SOB FIVE-LIKE 5-like [Rhododendron vialii]
MNGILAASECSSGCESGWTLYLDPSFLTPFPSLKGNDLVYSKGKVGDEEEEEEEEDSSMVSDASSGPPILQEDCEYGNSGNGCFCRAPIEEKNRGKGKKSGENGRRRFEEHSSLLDDTASSPIFNFSQQLNNNNYTVPSNQASMENILDFSESCSGTHFEVRSALHEPFGFFQSSLPGNQLQQNQWFREKMGMR